MSAKGVKDLYFASHSTQPHLLTLGSYLRYERILGSLGSKVIPRMQRLVAMWL